MKIKTYLIIPILALILVFFGLWEVKKAGAFLGQNPSSLIQKIAQKFGLKEEEVKAVFDEVKAEQKKQIQSRFEEKLTQAVKEGKLTEGQKQLILNKHQELQTKREQEKENWQNLTIEERREKIKQERTELENWAKQNNIDWHYLFGWVKFGKRSWWSK